MHNRHDITEARRPLVLLVDPKVESRHRLWRILSKAFGVIEATSAVSARRWIEDRPDIDALLVDDTLPDGRGWDLVSALARDGHPLAKRAIVLTGVGRPGLAGAVAAPGDVHAILTTLTSWLVARDVAEARHLLKELQRFPESQTRHY